MNNCKWDAIYNLFKNEELPFLYRSKLIDSSIFPEGHLRFDVREVMPLQLWLEIQSVQKISVGKLIKPNIIDNTPLAIELAEKAKSRFATTEHGLKVWGYLEKNESVQLYKSKT